MCYSSAFLVAFKKFFSFFSFSFNPSRHAATAAAAAAVGRADVEQVPVGCPFIIISFVEQSRGRSLLDQKSQNYARTRTNGGPRLKRLKKYRNNVEIVSWKLPFTRPSSASSDKRVSVSV